MPANPETIQIVVLIATPVATVAAAITGAKVALNGTKETVRRIERKVDDHHRESSARLGRVENDVQDVRERMVRVETRMDS